MDWSQKAKSKSKEEKALSLILRGGGRWMVGGVVGGWCGGGWEVGGGWLVVGVRSEPES